MTFNETTELELFMQELKCHDGITGGNIKDIQ